MNKYDVSYKKKILCLINYICEKFLKQECIPVGCVPSTVVAAGGGGCLPGGIHPPVNRMTDACENITLR